MPNKQLHGIFPCHDIVRNGFVYPISNSNWENWSTLDLGKGWGRTQGGADQVPAGGADLLAAGVAPALAVRFHSNKCQKALALHPSKCQKEHNPFHTTDTTPPRFARVRSEFRFSARWFAGEWVLARSVTGAPSRLSRRVSGEGRELR